jgi:peroxiredoxin
MRTDLKPGSEFPDIELPDHTGERVTLASLMGGFPTVVVFSRGYY